MNIWCVSLSLPPPPPPPQKKKKKKKKKKKLGKVVTAPAEIEVLAIESAWHFGYNSLKPLPES